jgi:hypothetical protein
MVAIGRPGMSWEEPFGFVVGIGAVEMVVATIVAAAVPVPAGWRFAVIAAAVFGFAAATLDHRALAVVVLIGAFLYDGFIEDRFGQLSWHGSDDLWRLMLLVIVGGFGLAAGEALRQLRDMRGRYSVATDGNRPSVPFREEE